MKTKTRVNAIISIVTGVLLVIYSIYSAMDKGMPQRSVPFLIGYALSFLLPVVVAAFLIIFGCTTLSRKGAKPRMEVAAMIVCFTVFGIASQLNPLPFAWGTSFTFTLFFALLATKLYGAFPGVVVAFLSTLSIETLSGGGLGMFLMFPVCSVLFVAVYTLILNGGKKWAHGEKKLLTLISLVAGLIIYILAATVWFFAIASDLLGYGFFAGALLPLVQGSINALFFYLAFLLMVGIERKIKINPPLSSGPSKYCTECGKRLPSDGGFCPVCGSKF